MPLHILNKSSVHGEAIKSEDAANRIFSLSMHPYLEQKDQAFIAGFMV